MCSVIPEFSLNMCCLPLAAVRLICSRTVVKKETVALCTPPQAQSHLDTF